MATYRLKRYSIAKALTGFNNFAKLGKEGLSTGAKVGEALKGTAKLGTTLGVGYGGYKAVSGTKDIITGQMGIEE